MKQSDQVPADTSHDANREAHDGHRRNHRGMMMICWIPMVVIAVALVATGVVSAGLLFIAFVCLGMMAAMMRGMNHSGSGT